MNTEELTATFCTNHQDLVAYIDSLPEDQFTYSCNGKWTAGQQLSHVYLCLVPIGQALASKDFIRQKFGVADRPVWGYDNVIANYKKALEEGGKAPDRFVPEPFDTSRRTVASADLLELLQVIRKQLNGYTDDETRYTRPAASFAWEADHQGNVFPHDLSCYTSPSTDRAKPGSVCCWLKLRHVGSVTVENKNPLASRKPGEILKSVSFTCCSQ